MASVIRSPIPTGNIAPGPGDPPAEPVIEARILMVDDRPANLLALEAILAPMGHRLVRANSGQEALRKLLEEDFAIILMDVQMPGIDGFETTRLIKERPRTRDVPIIFITAISREAEHVFQAYSHGAVDYMMKPLEPDILRSKVGVFVDLYCKGEQIKLQAARILEQERDAYQRRSEERYRRLMDVMPLCALGAKADGTIYYVNRVWQDYTGLSLRQTSGFVVPEVVHPEDVGGLVDAWGSALATGKPLERPFRLRRKSDGAWRWHLARAVAEEVGSRISGWIVTATDMDDQIRAVETAEQANRTKDEFLATVSHELRTPLNAILGWSSMAKSGILAPDKQVRALESIHRNALAQGELIEDILDVSRIVSGNLRLKLRAIDLAEVVTAALDTVRPVADAKGVTLVARLPGDSSLASGDPDRLQQVVWNLVSNAIKFTPRGGTVEVRLAREDSETVIRVVDDGMGIAASFLPLVFDRFRQADGTSTRAHGGLGLGLAIVRHLVELHGGVVRADSAGQGHGSTFSVHIPIRVLPPAGEEPKILETPGLKAADGKDDGAMPRLDGMRVLYVDDHADAREAVSELLRLQGAIVTTCASVAEAIASLDLGLPDVLVSDIAMPGEDGYSLIRRLRMIECGRGTAIPAVAVTGFARDEDGRRAINEGFQTRLVKPVAPFELVSLLATLAGRTAP